MTAARTTPWLVSARFDAAWLIGGAGLSLAAAATALAAPGALVALWWVWLLCFDGPHMMASYSRTYLDRQAWRTRRRLLVGSPAVFAIGPACLAMDAALGTDAAFASFLALAATYGYYHIVRQHYGFVALYKAKVGERDRLGFYVDKWALYAGCWAPYLYFVVCHPALREAAGVGDSPAPVWLRGLLWAVWVGALGALVWQRRRTASARSGPKLAYALITIGLHGLIYGVIGFHEPVYADAVGLDQTFLLVAIMLTVFHNVQYLALVYIHNRSRYANDKATHDVDNRIVNNINNIDKRDDGRPVDHGPARWVSRSALRFLAVCLLFSPVYLMMAGLTGVFPGFAIGAGAALGSITLGQLGLALWWGQALHHYVLDQRIWRIKDDPALRHHLGLVARA